MSAHSDRRTRLSHILLTAVLLVGGMMFGFATQALVAYYFGASARSDALFLARDTADMLAKLLLGAQAAGVLTPLYLTLRLQRGSEEASRAVACVMTLVLMVALPISIVAALTAPLLVPLIAPGFDASTSDLAVDLLRILSPTVVALATGALGVAMLQAGEHFGRAMGTNLVGGAVALGSMALLVPSHSVRGAAAALLLGAGSQAIAAWALLVRTGMPPVAAPWRDREIVQEFLRRLAPFAAYAGAVQISGVVLRVSVSLLATGVFAVLALTQRFYRAVVTVTLTPIQMVLLPTLARTEASGAPGSSSRELFAALRSSLALIAPVAAGLFVLRGEAVSIAYQRGEFSLSDAKATATTLGWYALPLVPVGLYLLLEQAGYAQRRTRLVVGVNVGLEAAQAALYLPLTQLLGVRGVPIAVTVATSFATIEYLRRLHPTAWRSTVFDGGFVLRIGVATLAMAAATAGAAEVLSSNLEPSPGLAQLSVALPAAVTGIGIYLLATVKLGVSEVTAATALIMEHVRTGASKRRPGTR